MSLSSRNSVLQVLFSCPELISLLTALEKQGRLSEKPLSTKLLNLYRAVYIDMIPRSQICELLIDFKEYLSQLDDQYKGSAQHDAYELIGLITTEMDRELEPFAHQSSLEFEEEYEPEKTSSPELVSALCFH